VQDIGPGHNGGSKMAGKDGSTRQSVGADQLEQPSREYMTRRKLYVVRNENDHGARTADTTKRRGMLDRTQQAQLGNLLRAIFSDVAEEPVPDRFVKLLEVLEAREKKQ
jgi:Anti-sigma factor NepR